MNFLPSALEILLGIVLLFGGGELFVAGSSALALLLGIPQIVIGLTVVSLGTSAPELFVSLISTFQDGDAIAVSNVVGSNIFNVLFILGVSALIAPLVASAQLVRLDVPVMIGASGLVWLLAMDGSIGRVEGVGLLLGIVAYTALLIYLGKRNSQPSIQKNSEGQIPPKKTASIGRSILFVAVGLVLLVLGARWLVDGAVELARMLGVSELMIGLTIVAAGTSMPEVATSVVASIRGERDIAIGNVVGSNIFNIMAVLGASAVIAPNGVAAAPAALRFDIPVMAAIAFACLPVFFTGGRISRWEGAMFLGCYGAYVAFLILTAVRHTSLAAFSSAMLWFVIPISTLGVAMSVLLWTKKRRREAVSE